MVLNTGASLETINITNIALILKKSKSLNPSEFCPISLCNVLYKLVSKMLVNRMKPFLDSIADPFQSAFIAGRSIFDNIMVVHEVILVMKNIKSGNN